MKPMKMKRYGSFDEYLADQLPTNRSIIRTLRTFVKRVAPGLKESVKWGNGCWVMGNVPVAYVYSTPDYVQFGFFRGSGLKDPQRILEGKGQYVRHIKVRKASDIDEDTLDDGQPFRNPMNEGLARSLAIVHVASRLSLGYNVGTLLH